MPKYEQERIIHIDWEGPIQLEAAKTRKDPTDYGVYQIYGGHPVYGSSALLYIGCAVKQPFGVRLQQEETWDYNRDAQRVEVYLGRLSGSATPDGEEWDNDIGLAERLLIYAHRPPFNAQTNLAAREPELQDVHVLNWLCHRDLLPEVSGARWTSRFDVWEEYHAFNEEE
jgi:hypothetical protein